MRYALEIAAIRELEIYGRDRHDPETLAILKSFEDFVALCEEHERETGEPCRIFAR